MPLIRMAQRNGPTWWMKLRMQINLSFRLPQLILLVIYSLDAGMDTATQFRTMETVHHWPGNTRPVTGWMRLRCLAPQTKFFLYPAMDTSVQLTPVPVSLTGKCFAEMCFTARQW